MKKLLLAIGIIFVFNIFCGASRNSNKPSFNEMQKNNSEFYQKCSKIAETFQYDKKFNMYLRSSCIEFEYNRKMLVELIYPKAMDNIPNYSYNMQTYRTNYSIRLNSEKINSYKPIIDEYCKLHTRGNSDAQEACKNIKTLLP